MTQPSYKPPPRWWRCTTPDCDVRWDSPVKEPCWSCGNPEPVDGPRCRPALTSGQVVSLT